MEAVLTAAAESGLALEINAHPMRLDLDDVYAKRALELGCLLAINTDAHHAGDLKLAFFGVGIARRAWATTENVINAWPPEKLLHWLDERGHRRLRKPPPPVAPPAPPPAKKTPAKVEKRPAKRTGPQARPASRRTTPKVTRRGAAKTRRKKK
jgi:hypothetical protein